MVGGAAWVLVVASETAERGGLFVFAVDRCGKVVNIIAANVSPMVRLNMALLLTGDNV